jgi:hypothetical protein
LAGDIGVTAGTADGSGRPDRGDEERVVAAGTSTGPPQVRQQVVERDRGSVGQDYGPLSRFSSSRMLPGQS